MVGVGGEMQPDFEGAKRYSLHPIPIFSIHPAGSPDQFRSPFDNAGLTLLDFGGFHAGPVGKFVRARTASTRTELGGLGDVKAAFQLGGFLEYFPLDWLRTRAEIRQGIGGETGLTADLSSDLVVPLSQQWTISGGPRFTLETAAANAPYFSVIPVQAMNSGLPAFNAKGGPHAVGAGTQVRYQFNRQWEAHSYVEYSRLLGDAASSPLVTLRGSPNQAIAGVGVSYSFDVRVR
ncbi:MAG: MipA/OmpV family protein, partial [Bradyrhizobiaceae bacterium]|nr:MipA/OmpV family protein [Bradyrhizobiaceae bacterium]